MKPSNCFMVIKDGEADFVKLLDFGISKVQQAGNASLRPKPTLPSVRRCTCHPSRLEARGTSTHEATSTPWASSCTRC